MEFNKFSNEMRKYLGNIVATIVLARSEVVLPLVANFSSNIANFV